MLRGALPPVRPVNATLPDVPLESIPGRYHDEGYGDITICAIPAHGSTFSSVCQETLANNPFPQQNLKVPTFIARYDKMAFDYLLFSHHNGSRFTVTASATFPEKNETIISQFETFDAIFADNGLAFTGNAWGAGPGVEGKESSAMGVKEAAEVWFERR